MKKNYLLAFVRLCPGAQVICNGDDNVYENYTWLDSRPMPTKAECDAVMPDIERENLIAVQKSLRQFAFQAESDPIFFAWQRGEATQEDWLAKVEEIRERFPYPS